ncbi:MAG: hypothetical protein DRQ65_08290 [Gammaproteobacteria bacterium]|nr:MAG: hypothetical protein DRQ65_08290 [Gammaproteobacteria bacterium]
MTQTSDAYAQLADHIAGTLYDAANEGEPENDDLYETFEHIASSLLKTFDVTITKTDPLEATLSIKSQ